MSVTARPCARCGGEIPEERIEALPETRICVACSREIGGEFEVRVIWEHLGKAGSLKKNYGGISVEKRRKRVEFKLK
jgi:reverse gyrase